MSKTKIHFNSYLKQGKYIFLYNIFERLTFFAFYISIARYVDKDLYGLVVVVSTFSNIISSIFDLGFPFYIQRESAIGKFSERSLSYVISLKFLLIIVLLPIPILYFLNENKYTIIILIALINFYYPINQILVSYLNGKEKFRESFYSILVTRLFLFSLFFLYTIYRIDIKISLLSIIIVLFLQTIYLSRYIEKASLFSLIIKINPKELLKIVKYSIPFGLGVIFTMTYDRVDVLILKHFTGNIEVAIYSIAYSLYRHTSIFSTTILLQAYNKYSRIFDQEKILRIDLLKNELALLLTIAIGLIFIFNLFGEAIIKLIYTEKFIDSYEYLRLISYAIPFIFLNNFTGILLNSKKLEIITMFTTFLGLIINVICNFMLIPHLKIYGAVYATIINEASILFFQVLFLIKFKNK